MTTQLHFRAVRCTGCLTCVVACKQENRTGPGVSWLRVERVETRSPDSVSWRLRLCLQCADPPCVDQCPTGALRKSADGLVSINSEHCLPGCGLCAAACPHGALQTQPAADYFGTDLERTAAALPHQQHRSGTISLCTLCAHRTDGNTACASSCPTGALIAVPTAGPPLVRLA
jgi:Fe-S-cluster-containing dehydrogenase component